MVRVTVTVPYPSTDSPTVVLGPDEERPEWIQDLPKLYNQLREEYGEWAEIVFTFPPVGPKQGRGDEAPDT